MEVHVQVPDEPTSCWRTNSGRLCWKNGASTFVPIGSSPHRRGFLYLGNDRNWPGAV